MMIPFSDLRRKRFRLDAFDGTLGQAHDFYLTDENWTIRYLIARLGGRFRNRRVLLPVYLLERIHREGNAVSVAMTRLQIRQSAPIESKQRISERRGLANNEKAVMEQISNGSTSSAAAGRDSFASLRPGMLEGLEPRENCHLHSCEALLKGFVLHAVDGKIGSVTDIIIDDSEWRARYLVVQTGPMFGRKLVLSARSLANVSVEKQEIQLNLMRSLVDESPDYGYFERSMMRST